MERQLELRALYQRQLHLQELEKCLAQQIIKPRSRIHIVLLVKLLVVVLVQSNPLCALQHRVEKVRLRLVVISRVKLGQAHLNGNVPQAQERIQEVILLTQLLKATPALKGTAVQAECAPQT